MNRTRRSFLITGVGSLTANRYRSQTASFQTVSLLSPPSPTIEWQISPSDDVPFIPVEIRGNSLYVSSNGNIAAYDCQTGDERWRYSNLDRVDVPFPDGFAQHRLFLTSPRGLIALDIRDGTEAWRINDDTPQEGSLTVQNSTVYYVNQDVSAFSTADGHPRWTYKLPMEATATPFVQDERLYVGTTGGTLHALSTEGQMRWQYTPNRVQSGKVSTMLLPLTDEQVTVEGRSQYSETVFVWGANTGVLYALNDETGRESWQYLYEGDSLSFPGVVDDSVYLIHDSTLQAIDPTDGTLSWQFSADGDFQTTPFATNDHVLVATDSKLFSIGKDDGEVHWTSELRTESLTVLTSSSDFAVRVGEPSTMRAVNPATGELSWQWTANSELTMQTATDGTVYVGTVMGKVYALKPPDGMVASVRTEARDPSSLVTLGAGGLLGAGLLVGAYRRIHDRFQSGSGQKYSNTADDQFALADFTRKTVRHSGELAIVETVSAPSCPERTFVLTRLTGVENAPKIRRSFIERVRRWESHDETPGVSTVIAWGDDPEPWVATPTPKAGRFDERVNDMTLGDRVRSILTTGHVLHQMHQQGVPHLALTPKVIGFEERNEPGGLPNPSSVVVGGWERSAIPRLGTTTAYTSPEQQNHDSIEVPEWSDVYQLGAVAYYVLTRTIPDSQTPSSKGDGSLVRPSERNPDLPFELDEILLKALAATPQKRYDSAVSFCDDLRWASFIQNDL